MSKFYFSYGDIGGIIGRLTQYKSIIYGSKGLWVCPNQKTINKILSMGKINLQTSQKLIAKSIQSNIFLTNKPDEICKFIDLDWETWTNGFGSKEEIFIWLKN